MEVILSTILAAYAVVSFPPGYLLLTAIVSIAAYAFTESYFSVVGVLIVMSVLRLLKSTLLPTIESSRYGAINGPDGSVKGAEGFQPRDPVSIHKRIEEGKKGAPLQPKGDGVQGVLEAPSILSSLSRLATWMLGSGASLARLSRRWWALPSRFVLRRKGLCRTCRRRITARLAGIRIYRGARTMRPWAMR